MTSPAKTFVGFETFFNNARMAFKMQVIIIGIILLLICATSLIVFKKSLDPTQRSIFRAYYTSYMHGGTDIIDVFIAGKTYHFTYDYVTANYKNYAIKYRNIWLNNSKWTLLYFLLLIPGNFIFYRRAKSQSASQYIRGAELVTAKELNKIIKKKEETYLPVGQVKMPVSAEVLVKKVPMIESPIDVDARKLLAQAKEAEFEEDAAIGRQLRELAKSAGKTTEETFEALQNELKRLSTDYPSAESVTDGNTKTTD